MIRRWTQYAVVVLVLLPLTVAWYATDFARWLIEAVGKPIGEWCDR